MQPRHAGTTRRAVQHGKYKRSADPLGITAERTAHSVKWHGYHANEIPRRRVNSKAVIVKFLRKRQ